MAGAGSARAPRRSTKRTPRWSSWRAAPCRPRRRLHERSRFVREEGRWFYVDGESVRFDAVLFDCDGVLVDSEGITNGVLRDMLGGAGLEADARGMHAHLPGQGGEGRAGVIEAKTGQPLTEEWLARFRERRNEELIAGVQPIRNACRRWPRSATASRAASPAARAPIAGRWRCSSARCGLLPYFDGRIYSGHEMPRSKPAPDVYLAAMAQLGAAARRCAVVEDTVTASRRAWPRGRRCSATARPRRATTRRQRCVRRELPPCSRTWRTCLRCSCEKRGGEPRVHGGTRWAQSALSYIGQLDLTPIMAVQSQPAENDDTRTQAVLQLLQQHEQQILEEGLQEAGSPSAGSSDAGRRLHARRCRGDPARRA